MIQDYIEECLQKMNSTMIETLVSEDALMQEIMDYVLSEKGKQLRSRMLLSTAYYGNRAEKAVLYAAMIEIIHMASLVHDDVIDESDKRRGRASVQAKYGKKMAVYAGDFMLFSCFSHLYKSFDKKFIFVIDSLNSVCYGELGQSNYMFNPDVTVETYLNNIYGKTAVAFQMACKAGAVATRVSAADVNRFDDFGKAFGILFQIRDDLLDYQNESEVQEKPCFQDFIEGIYTIPVILLMRYPEIKDDIADMSFKNRDGLISDEVVREKMFKYLAEYEWKSDFTIIVDDYYNQAKTAVKGLKQGETVDYLEGLLDSNYNDIMRMANNIIF